MIYRTSILWVLTNSWNRHHSTSMYWLFQELQKILISISCFLVKYDAMTMILSIHESVTFAHGDIVPWRPSSFFR